ncbi:hypothetical protein PCANC_15930 [Puccinia coronata f. sp. avenae]|uniref:Uncharacterized protein n=1 Tax=Puccinia coronata f. sp. avenae TaxID=200324 RepID=A0A2N5SPF7_9BASI|nr:hypothetical protein PCANC_15930 [Puccinia coronata f. sp. avenae]
MIPCVPAVPLKIPHAPTLTLEDFLNLFGISQEDMATHHRMIALDVTHWTYFCPNLPLNVKAQTQRLVIQFLKRLQLLHHSEVMERLGCAISDKRNKQIIGHAWDSPADQLNCHSCADLDLEEPQPSSEPANQRRRLTPVHTQAVAQPESMESQLSESCLHLCALSARSRAPTPTKSNLRPDSSVSLSSSRAEPSSSNQPVNSDKNSQTSLSSILRSPVASNQSPVC